MGQTKVSLDQQLCFALYRASRAVIRAYGPLLQPYGLTYLQYLVLMVLWEDDGLTVKDIGQKLSLDSGTLTPLLKKLAEADLLERRRQDRDERVVRISLTRHGKDLQQKLKTLPSDLACSGRLDLATGGKKIEKLRQQLHELASQFEQT